MSEKKTRNIVKNDNQQLGSTNTIMQFLKLEKISK